VPLVIGDLIMAEVLLGLADENEFRRAEKIFEALEFRPMVGREIAAAAARNYRSLRGRGITVCETIDILIATLHRARPSPTTLRPRLRRLRALSRPPRGTGVTA